MCQFIGWCALDQSAQAAWAQAALSGLAIFFAAMFPAWQERTRTRQKVEAYAGMIRTAKAAASRDAETVAGVVDGLGAVHWNAMKWDRLAEAFDGVPYHDLPDYRLFDLLHDAGDRVREFRDTWRNVHAGALENKPGTRVAGEKAKEIATALECLYDKALAIRDSHTNLVARAWLKLKQVLRNAKP